jgi:S-adenosylmethionine synthetase
MNNEFSYSNDDLSDGNDAILDKVMKDDFVEKSTRVQAETQIFAYHIPIIGRIPMSKSLLFII